MVKIASEVHWRDNTPVTSRFEKEVLDFKFFHPFSLPKMGCLDDQKCKENGKKKQPPHSSKLSHNL